MKIKFFLVCALVLIVAGLIAGYQMKTEEAVLSARYQMLACENCFHMTVENSTDSTLIGETIIPVSDVVDIEEMINSVAISKEPLCLKGRFYRFNFNLLGFSPDGKRFEVVSIESRDVCSGIKPAR